MEYHILNEGEIIASFKYEEHRDYSIEEIRDWYSDCEFSTKDGKVI